MFDFEAMGRRHMAEGLDDFEHYFAACGEMAEEIRRLEREIESLTTQLKLKGTHEDVE